MASATVNRLSKTHESKRPLSKKSSAKCTPTGGQRIYLSVGQNLPVTPNPLLQEPLKLEHIKPRLLGHWGTTPGLNFYLRTFQPADKKYDLNVIYVTGTGARRTGFGRQHVSRGHLQRDLSARFGKASMIEETLQSNFHFLAESPATSRQRRRARSTRAANLGTLLPTLMARRSTIRTCWFVALVGDGEAETGPLAASWHSNKFLNPARDGAVSSHPAPERL